METDASTSDDQQQQSLRAANSSEIIVHLGSSDRNDQIENSELQTNSNEDTTTRNVPNMKSYVDIVDNVDEENDPDEPPSKKIRLEQCSPENGMEPELLLYRLGCILRCCVCFDLVTTATYQCRMGHLVCVACFSYLLADGRWRNEATTCPSCRVEISDETASRNLAVEQAVSELPGKCQYCGGEYPYKNLKHHQMTICKKRPTDCKYSRIGCQWRGPNNEKNEHESNCHYLTKSAHEIMTELEAKDANILEDKKMHETLINILSEQKIRLIDVMLRFYNNENFIYYESSRFTAFGYAWSVMFDIQNMRTINYSLMLRSRPTVPMNISFFVLKGPFSDTKIAFQMYSHRFTEVFMKSEYFLLPVSDSLECNRLLVKNAINIRLVMVSK